jgi:hypothetical protein
MERIQAEYEFIKANGQRDLVGYIEAGVFTVAEVYARSPGNFAVQEANAEFIVRAVNSHDQLVAALKRFANLDKSVDSDLWYIRSEFCEQARAALAAAGEQS